MRSEAQSKHLDPSEPTRLYASILSKSTELFSRVLNRQPDPAQFKDDFGIWEAFARAWSRVLADPLRLAEHYQQFWIDSALLWQNAMLRLMGHAPAPLAQPEPNDRRFRHPDWQEHFLFDFVKQSYLIAARHLHRLLAGVQGLDEQAARKVDFYTRQYVDALAPTNFLLTNPEVLRETVATGGRNLLKGLEHLLDDLVRDEGGTFRLRLTDERAFQLGRDIATTPGKIVWQNNLMQLIQYEPTTATVKRRPLLIVPPWINKYYILDLRESNSFVRWAVAQGHTLFMISWVNPGPALAGKHFDDYLAEGLLAALGAIEQATGEREVNAIGYCLGGTLLATALGYMAAKNDARIRSATFFASLIDFSEPGELKVFIDERQVAALERRMARRGYLEGAEMANTFNLLRANDLIWSVVVHNYLLGRDPVPFDLLYWNADATRMPATMHGEYLRNFYLKNLLVKPGGLRVLGTPVDLARVKTPAYFISTQEDHIAPWRSTYAGARRLGGPVRFVLGGSGHIAGIVNPPAANKYAYFTNDRLPEAPDEWLAGARRHPGSWWTDWAKWVSAHGGGEVPARQPGSGALCAIEDAPGSYVRMRVN